MLQWAFKSYFQMIFLFKRRLEAAAYFRHRLALLLTPFSLTCAAVLSWLFTDSRLILR